MVVDTLQVSVEEEVFAVMAEREYSGAGHRAIPKREEILQAGTLFSFSKCLFGYN